MSWSSRDAFNALEDDLFALSRYIAFQEDNFCVYSLELANLLLRIGSEVEVFTKACMHGSCEDECNKKTNIHDYVSFWTSDNRFKPNIRIRLTSCDLLFSPWQSLESKERPPWWISYNSVKHNRLDAYRDANLGNVLNAAAGFFYLLLFKMEIFDFMRVAGSEPCRGLRLFRTVD
ncbi:hypothetical protein [Desulfocurvus vexinensis]|uniref:hypothetical protein n=1 Tax=Desulfocurvus vexinensis TaxID=399548 RepID=UPI0012EB2206|nr:hypothetical protein [Desulfocurvus vexinensis]